MPDIVVTVPLAGWAAWLQEGDPAVLPGEPPKQSSREYAFCLGLRKPDIKPGERVYVVSHYRVRGYAPLVKLTVRGRMYYAIRRGGAVAVTIPRSITGTRGYSRRGWDQALEVPFPQWHRVNGEWDGIDRVVKAAREVLELTQGDVARRLDWAVSRVAMVESGQFGVRPEEVPAVLRSVGLDEEAFHAAVSGVPIGDCLGQAQGRQLDPAREPGDGDVVPAAAGHPDDAAGGGADGARGRIPGEEDGAARPWDDPAGRPGGAQHLELPGPRVVAGVVLTWSRDEPGVRCLVLRAERGPAARQAKLAVRPDVVTMRRLMDETERQLLRELGV